MDRTLTTLLSTLALPLGLSACAAEAPEGGEPSTGDPLPTAASADSTRMYMVRLDGVRRSDVVGSAGFVPQGEQTMVISGVRGVPEGAILEGGIYQGESCDDLGTAVFPLDEIRPGNDGTGRSSSTVAADIGSVFDGGHLLVYRGAGGAEGATIVCGDIPMLVPLVEEAAPTDGA